MKRHLLIGRRLASPLGRYCDSAIKITSGAPLVILVPVDRAARFITTLAESLDVAKLNAGPIVTAVASPRYGTWYSPNTIKTETANVPSCPSPTLILAWDWRGLWLLSRASQRPTKRLCFCL